MARASKNKENQNDVDTSMDIKLTPEHKRMIQSLIHHQMKIKLEQEALSEDIKAVAQKLNIKPGEVKEMVTWIIQEQEKGGVVENKEKKLEFIKQVLEHFDETSDSLDGTPRDE